MRNFPTIDELRCKVEMVMAAHPGLSMHGFGVVGEGILALEDIETQRSVEQQALLGADSLRAIAFVQGWITTHLSRDSKRINRRRTAMALKHLAEGQTGYLAQGQLIVAMLLEGYALERVGADVFFNVTEDSVRRSGMLPDAVDEAWRQRRVIRQTAPATGWVAMGWMEEARRWVEAPLVAWAVVDEGVVGLVADTAVDESDEGRPAPVFADEFSNFRGYRYKGEA